MQIDLHTLSGTNSGGLHRPILSRASWLSSSVHWISSMLSFADTYQTARCTFSMAWSFQCLLHLVFFLDTARKISTNEELPNSTTCWTRGSMNFWTAALVDPKVRCVESWFVYICICFLQLVDSLKLLACFIERDQIQDMQFMNRSRRDVIDWPTFWECSPLLMRPTFRSDAVIQH